MSFSAARLYLDPQCGVSFWYPADWRRFELPDNPHSRGMFGIDERNGVILEVYELEDDDGTPLEVTADDLPDLDEHLRGAILALPDAQLLVETPVERRHSRGFEKLYTFRQGEQTWKKRGLFLFAGCRQVNLLAQVDSLERFDQLYHEFDVIFGQLDPQPPRSRRTDRSARRSRSAAEARGTPAGRAGSG